MHLDKMKFFYNFLNLTNTFSDGFMPDYTGYDVSEHLYPTLARQFGGAVGVLSAWDIWKWHGNHKMYPIRWRPELEMEKDIFPETTLCHPVKSFDHPIRKHYREERNDAKNKNGWSYSRLFNPTSAS